MTDSVSGAAVGLEDAPTLELKEQWRRPLRDRAAALQPPLPRKPARLSDSGTGLRGPKPETVERLEALGEELDGRQHHATPHSA